MKKVLRILSITVLAIVMVLCVVACESKPETQKAEVSMASRVSDLNDSIHDEWSKLRPLTVFNEIIITAEDAELVRYNKEYVLLEDNVGKIVIDTMYLGDEDCDLNNYQEMYFSNNKISMRYEDVNGESIRSYNANMDTFMELVADGANNIFAYNYVFDYFGDVSYEELDDAVKMTFDVLDECVDDFLGESGLPVTNMSFSYTMFNDISKMIVEFNYDTVEGDTVAHVTARCIASEEGVITMPEWA